MTTSPGFSSRSTAVTFHQFPQRDGAAVSEIAGMETPGWSNSDPADHAPDDVHPEVSTVEFTPGESNGAAVEEPEPHEPTEHAIVTATADSTTTTAKKTTARKSSARKKG